MKLALPRVEVRVADRVLADRIEGAVAAALLEARRTTADAIARTLDLPVVRLRTRRRLAALGVGAVAGALVLVRVTAAGGRRLVGLVDALRAAPVAGVQLVWDGEDPTREEVEAHVFAALELARATPNGPPVVVTRSKAPIAALRALVAKRKDRSG